MKNIYRNTLLLLITVFLFSCRSVFHEGSSMISSVHFSDTAKPVFHETAPLLPVSPNECSSDSLYRSNPVIRNQILRTSAVRNKINANLSSPGDTIPVLHTDIRKTEEIKLRKELENGWVFFAFGFFLFIPFIIALFIFIDVQKKIRRNGINDTALSKNARKGIIASASVLLLYVICLIAFIVLLMNGALLPNLNFNLL